MFGPAGGNKAMAPVAGGHLIDYVVREIEVLSPVATIVLAVAEDQATPVRVRALTASQVTVVASPSDGTGPGVRRLLAAARTEYVALSTCDLAAGTGSLTTFFKNAVGQVSIDEPRCVVAVSPLDETDPAPIFVHTSGSAVIDYGKRAPQSSLSFAGARLMNSAFASILMNSSQDLITDTEMMTSLVHEFPGTVRAMAVQDLFDVDNPLALERAAVLTREDPLASRLSGVDGRLPPRAH